MSWIGFKISNEDTFYLNVNSKEHKTHTKQQSIPVYLCKFDIDISHVLFSLSWSKAKSI